MILKQGSSLEESSDSSEDEENEEEASLNFMNLKMIDRKSSDLTSLRKERTSRVTILGDTLVEYNREEDEDK